MEQEDRLTIEVGRESDGVIYVRPDHSDGTIELAQDEDTIWTQLADVERLVDAILIAAADLRRVLEAEAVDEAEESGEGVG